MDEPHRRRELAAFLRARRHGTTPAQVGLPNGGRRKTPGLRREEVAQLSGVGLTWYTWLEQGRDIAASAQVVDALAHALQLDEPAHRHLRALANLAIPQPVNNADAADSMLVRLLENLQPNPAYALDRHFDYVAWNESYAATWQTPSALPTSRRNLIWAFFTDPFIRDLVVDWEGRARILLAQFRAAAGRQAGDPRFAELIDALNHASLEFRTWWPHYQVGDCGRPQHKIRHPRLGPITLELSQLSLSTHPGFTIVLQTPRTSQDREKLVTLLARTPSSGSTGQQRALKAPS